VLSVGRASDMKFFKESGGFKYTDKSKKRNNMNEQRFVDIFCAKTGFFTILNGTFVGILTF
jgi:hypothetical protein